MLSTGTVEPPGFIFWGLFLVFGVVVLGYLVWMLLTEHKERIREGQGANRGGR